MGFTHLAIVVETNAEKIVEEISKKLKPKTEVNWREDLFASARSLKNG